MSEQRLAGRRGVDLGGPPPAAVPETTITPTRPPGAAPHGARQATVSGNNVGKTTSANWARMTVCAAVRGHARDPDRPPRRGTSTGAGRPRRPRGRAGGA